MAVRNDGGHLSITFPFNGKRRTEYLGMRDSRENRRSAQKLNDQIKAEIKAGNFNYAGHFPEQQVRQNPQRHGQHQQSVPENLC
jgi:hypothetical protein